jgi:hypothetical protein
VSQIKSLSIALSLLAASIPPLLSGGAAVAGSVAGVSPAFEPRADRVMTAAVREPIPVTGGLSRG